MSAGGNYGKSDQRTRNGQTLLIALLVAVPVAGIVLALVNGESNSLWLATIIAITLVLLYRGKRWIRWPAVTLLFLSGVGTAMNGWIELTEDPVHGYFGLSVGLIYLAGSGLLAFSESIGDFVFDQGLGRTVSELWREVLVGFPPSGSRHSRAQPAQAAQSLEQVVALAGRRARVVRTLTGIILIVFGIAAMGTFYVLLTGGVAMTRGLAEIQDLDTRIDQNREESGFSAPLALQYFERFLGVVFRPFFLVFFYVTFITIPYVVTLPYSLLIAITWRNPPRFLLLRPFNRKRYTGVLRSIVRAEVAPFGHTYSLADAHLKTPWYVKFPAFLGQFALFSFRFPTIREPLNLDVLRHVIRRRVSRNLNWCVSFGKIFPISCLDVGWKGCVSGLLGDVDVILLELSELREGLIWELRACRRLGVANRMIAMVHAESLTAFQERCRTDELLQDLRLSPIVWDEQGLREPGSLSTRVAEAIGVGQSGESIARLPSRGRLQSQLRAAVAFLLGSLATVIVIVLWAMILLP